jgi:hypothetical protein
MFRFTHLKIALALAGVLAVGAPIASAQEAKPDESRDLNLRAYTDLLRSDIRAQKSAIITEVMEFSDEEDAKFWPVYREYETELTKINDERLELIKDYATKYDKLTDADANRIATGALDLEARRHALKAKYYDRLKSVLPAKTAARALQVENQILLLLDLQIAAGLPVAK